VSVSSVSSQRDNCVAEKFCLNDISGNCDIYGGLYQWDELMDFQTTEGSQGRCPFGWHVPSETDWNTLFQFYTNSAHAAAQLKISGNSGFNASLTGIDFNNANWKFNTFATYFWTSSYDGPNKAWAHAMNFYETGLSYYPSLRSNAYYVRCIEN
jgi:uncharacterized protein (TIGR02145 family)